MEEEIEMGGGAICTVMGGVLSSEAGAASEACAIGRAGACATGSCAVALHWPGEQNQRERTAQVASDPIQGCIRRTPDSVEGSSTVSGNSLTDFQRP